MLLKTHLAIGLFAMFIFLNFIEHKVVFVIVLLIASVLPDLDHAKSYVGRNWLLRPLQFLTRHRGFFHSFTFTAVVAIAFWFLYQPLVLPFILGYGLHLIADAWSMEGIRPFWPFRYKVNFNPASL